MPTYEYACSSCKHEWEFEQSIKDNAITECPQCKQQTAKRQISRGTGFILKGSGWYSDLYSSSSNKSPSSGDSGGGSSSTSTTSSSDTKASDKGGKGDGGASAPPAASSSGSSGSSGGTKSEAAA